MRNNENGQSGPAAPIALEVGSADEYELSSGDGVSVRTELEMKLKTREAVIGVVGLGYVGLPLAVEFARRGFSTIGFDVDERRVQRLQDGHNYIGDVDDDELRTAVNEGRLRASTDVAVAETPDVFFICVPTPVRESKDPDTSYISAASEAIARQLRRGQLVVLKSTTYPNTTEGLVRPILERAALARDLTLGVDYFLAFSPERVDPGNQQFTTANTPVVVGGVTEACTELAALTMQQVVALVHPVSSPKVAEMEKLLENIFRSVNIALVNELARLCDRMGDISIWEVIEAAATKPFGYMPFYPGPGLGGHCIPIDPYYLSWLARKYDFETSFITLSARTNEAMPFYVADAVVHALAEAPVRLGDAKVLILGVAFKKDVDDVRHSPALKVIRLLWEKGIRHVAYSDPHVPSVSVPADGGMVQLEGLALTEDVLQQHDLTLILTDHSQFPYSMVAEQAPRVLLIRT